MEETSNIPNEVSKCKPEWFNLLLMEGPGERDCPEDTRNVWTYGQRTGQALLGNF